MYHYIIHFHVCWRMTSVCGHNNLSSFIGSNYYHCNTSSIYQENWHCLQLLYNIIAIVRQACLLHTAKALLSYFGFLHLSSTIEQDYICVSFVHLISSCVLHTDTNTLDFWNVSVCLGRLLSYLTPFGSREGFFFFQDYQLYVFNLRWTLRNLGYLLM